jgi:Zn-dependent protease with chaperone function
MLGAVGEPGRAALLAHERAHLSGRHFLFATAARLAASANPLVRSLAGAVENTVERWADERAAAVVGDRRLVAETIAHAALATKASRPRRPLVAALGAVFGGPGALALSQAGPVPRRIAALLASPPLAA